MIPRGNPTPLDPGSTTVPPDRRPLEEQPKWRRDFPIDWPQDEWVSRRDLVKFVVLTSGAFAVGQLWIAVRSLFAGGAPAFAEMEIARVDQIPVGGALTFHYPEGSTPRLLVRTGESEFVAYDQQCTHLLCPVVPAVEQGRLHCPCHNGWFDLHTGEVLAGPPQRPLDKISLRVVDDRVIATGVRPGA